MAKHDKGRIQKFKEQLKEIKEKAQLKYLHQIFKFEKSLEKYYGTRKEFLKIIDGFDSIKSSDFSQDYSKDEIMKVIKDVREKLKEIKETAYKDPFLIVKFENSLAYFQVDTEDNYKIIAEFGQIKSSSVSPPEVKQTEAMIDKEVARMRIYYFQ